MIYKTSKQIEHVKLKAFQKECKTEVMFRNTLCGLKTYLNWRKISVDELIKNDLSELSFMEQFPNDEELNKNYTYKSLMVKIAFIKRFLRFCGIEFVRFDRKNQKRVYYFDEDKAFVDFLIYDLRDRKNTHRQHKNTMNHFLTFMNHEFNRKDDLYTPTELVEEIKDKKYSMHELRRLLQKFHAYNLTLKNKDGEPNFKKSTSWQHTLRIGKFYRLSTGLRVEWGDIDSIDEDDVNDIHVGGTIIDSEHVRTMFEKTNDGIRSKMVLMILFESGSSPSDIVNLQVKDFIFYDEQKNKQNYLNIDSPEEIKSGLIYMKQRKRMKTRKSFIFTISTQSLKLISQYLKLRRDGLLSNGLREDITEESYIITQLGSNTNIPLKAQSVARIISKMSKQANFKFLPRDFRKSWRSRINALKVITTDKKGNERKTPIMQEVTKNAILGHINTEFNYERNKIENLFMPEYFDCWLELFDLENTKMLERKYKFKIQKEVGEYHERLISELRYKIEKMEAKEAQEEFTRLEHDEKAELTFEQKEVNLTADEIIKLKKLLAKA